MNRKKQKLIEIFLITFFFFIFITLFQFQSFVIIILLVASITISLNFKNDIKEIILPKKKNFLYFILKSGRPDSRHRKNNNPQTIMVVLCPVVISAKNYKIKEKYEKTQRIFVQILRSERCKGLQIF